MASFNAMKIHEILEDDDIDREEKIIRLREIGTETGGLQRAASEGPMNDADGWDDDLRSVRIALEKLGADEPRKGAASL